MPEVYPDSTKKLLSWIIDYLHIDVPTAEKQSLAYLVMEHLLRVEVADIISDRSVNLSKKEWKSLNALLDRINSEEPIQYLLEEADFYGRKFMVNPAVLIPRNETEELVHLIIEDNKGKKIKLLDIGTGSGCIAVTLAKELSIAKVLAIDIDPRAIKVARKNAQIHHAEIDFLMLDILHEKLPVQGLEVIVSNPPYVTHAERRQMENNVLQYEPKTALFVDDETPLIFYEKIADSAKESLKEGGKLYFEINERFGAGVKSLLENKGYKNVMLKQDINGKDRIISATHSFTRY